MKLIYLDLENGRPGFIEDLTFSVIPGIEGFIDANFDFLDEDEEDFYVMVLSFSPNISGTP